MPATTFPDAFKARWPTIRGREDQEVTMDFFIDDPPTTPFDLSGFSNFRGAAHTHDGTTLLDPPLVTFTVDRDMTLTNRLIATLSKSQTGTLQEAGSRGKLDIFATDTAGKTKKLLEAVWSMDASVSLS